MYCLRRGTFPRGKSTPPKAKPPITPPQTCTTTCQIMCKEQERISKELDKARKNLASLNGKLSH